MLKSVENADDQSKSSTQTFSIVSNVVIVDLLVVATVAVK